MIVPRASIMSNSRLPSVAYNNINSMSLTAAGGIFGRKAKVIRLVAALVSTHGITCLQDVRVPSLELLKAELKPFFPHHKFYISPSGDINRGGTLIIVTPKIINDYDITHKVTYTGSIHYITLTHKQNKTKLNIVNCYLHASDEEIWKKQVNYLTHHINYNVNTLVGGDFNHVYNPSDRSGYHSDKTASSAADYQKWLSKHELQQIDQNYHTWYGKRGDDLLSSSKLDRIYHNLDFSTLALNTPKAYVCTHAPHTVAQYGFKCSYKNDTNFTTLIDNYKTQKEGGTHVTDHVPLSVRFSNPNDSYTSCFKTAAINNDDFIAEFDKRWTNSIHSSIPFIKLKEYKEVLTKTSVDVSKSTQSKMMNDSHLWDAVRLVNAIDQGENVHEKFSHIPEYLELADNPVELLSKINHSFAAKSLDENGHKTISRIETISRSLPKKKRKNNTFLRRGRGMHY